jgi:beta-lactamase superfamily II metal-dependent hydrolase
MADTFGVISLVGPLANAVVLPLLPAFIVLGAVGALAGAVNAHLGWLPLQLAGLGSRLVLAVAHLSAGVRGAAVHVGRWPWQWTVAEVAGVAAATTFFFVFRKRRPSLSPSLLRALLVGLVTAGLVVHLTAGADGRLHLDVLDVGPAPAVLVSAPAGRLMLVDGGADPTQLSTALGRVLSPLQRSLDLVVLTSTDRQAAAGLVGLEERYQVRRLLTPAQLNSASRDIADRYEKQGAVVVPEDGAGWDWDGTVLRCLRVDAESGSHCALQVADGGESALLLGTMGPQDQDQLPALFGTSLRAGLLVVPNPVGVSALLLDAVRPRLIASAAGTAGAAAALPSGVVSASTARDGDLRYSSGARGWERD